MLLYFWKTLLQSDRPAEPGAEITGLRWLSGRAGARIHWLMVVNYRNSWADVKQSSSDTNQLARLTHSERCAITERSLPGSRLVHVMQFQVLPTDQASEKASSPSSNHQVTETAPWLEEDRTAMKLSTFHSHLGAGVNVIGNKFHFCSIIVLGDVLYD